MDPSGKSALEHRPGATDYSSRHPSMAVLGELLLRQPRTFQGRKALSARGYLSGEDHGAKAGESGPARPVDSGQAEILLASSQPLLGW